MCVYPIPESWERFEEILAELIQTLLNDPGADRYGRQGQSQYGIDILARNRRSQKQEKHEVWAIQVKRYEKPPTVETAEKDFQKALKHFKQDIDVYILATTAKQDAKLQDWAVQKERENAEPDHSLRVEVWFWDNISRKLERYPHLREKYLKPFWDHTKPPLSILKRELCLKIGAKDDGMAVDFRCDDVSIAGAKGIRLPGRVHALHWELHEAWKELRKTYPLKESKQKQKKPGGALTSIPVYLEEMGRLLGEALLPPVIAGPFRKEIRQAQKEGLNVAVALASDDPAIHDLPLETMKIPGAATHPLSLNPGLTFSRRIPSAFGRIVDEIPGPLRILVLIGSPDAQNDRGELLDYERELRTILDAVEELSDSKVVVEILEEGNLEAVQKALKRWRYHVLHISCHAHRGALLLEDAEGRESKVSAKALIHALRQTGRLPPLVFLGGCQTGLAAAGSPSAPQEGKHAGETSVLSGFAQSLLEEGVPFVIAMQDTVSDPYATELAGLFYNTLSASDIPMVSLALAHARQKIQEDRKKLPDGDPRKNAPPEWATPAIFAAGEEQPLYDPRKAFETPPPRPKPVFASGICVRRIGDFVGRRAQRRRILGLLKSHDKPAVLIHGVGGVGKSTLAADILPRLVKDGVILASVAGKVSAEEVLKVIGESLSHHAILLEGETSARMMKLGSMLQKPEIPAPQRMGLLLPLVLPNHPLILLLDNFEDNLVNQNGKWQLGGESAQLELLLTEWLRNPGKSRFLITSRYPFDLSGVSGELPVRVHLGPLSVAETRKLMRRLDGLAELTPEERQDAYLKLGGHPRAIEYLDALLRGGKAQYADVTARLKKAYEERNIAVPESLEGISDAMESVILAVADDCLFDELLKTISTVPWARKILEGASVYQVPVDSSALAWQAGDEGPEEPEGFSKALSTLIGSSLLYEGKSAEDQSLYTVHRWTVHALQERMSGNKLKNCHRRAANYWQSLRTSEDKILLEWLFWACIHFAWADDWPAFDSSADPLTQYLYRTSQLGVLSLFHSHVMPILEFKNDKKRIPVLYGNQALILQAWGRLEEAMALHKKQQALKEELEDRAGLSRTYGNQALILQAWGRLEEAMALHKKEQALCEELEDRARLGKCFWNQALILLALKKYEQALMLFNRTLEIEKALGDPDYEKDKEWVEAQKRKWKK